MSDALARQEEAVRNLQPRNGRAALVGADGTRTVPQVVTSVSQWDGELVAPKGVNVKSYEKARLIRRDPTVRLVRKFAMAPLLAGKWTVECDDWAPRGLKELVEDAVVHKWRLKLLRSTLCGCGDYGWQPYEKTWFARPDGFLGPHLKPLLQDITTILVDQDSGAFWGLRQMPTLQSNRHTWTYLLGPECMVVSQDVEGTNWYGESTIGCLEATYDEMAIAERAARKYDARIAGTHWVIYYPLGTSTWEGATTDNGEIARKLLSKAESVGGLILPRSVSEAVDALTAGMANNEGTQWKVELLTDSGAGQTSFLDKLKYLDVKKVRAYGFPERALLEGQFGTKAEAEAHADLAVTNLDVDQQLFCVQYDEQLVDDVARFNYGEEAVGCCRLVPSPLSDDAKKYLRDLYVKLLENPEEAMTVDRDAVREKAGVPALPYDPLAGQQQVGAVYDGYNAPEYGQLQAQFSVALSRGDWDESEHPRAEDEDL